MARRGRAVFPTAQPAEPADTQPGNDALNELDSILKPDPGPDPEPEPEAKEPEPAPLARPAIIMSGNSRRLAEMAAGSKALEKFKR